MSFLKPCPEYDNVVKVKIYAPTKKAEGKNHPHFSFKKNIKLITHLKILYYNIYLFHFCIIYYFLFLIFIHPPSHSFFFPLVSLYHLLYVSDTELSGSILSHCHGCCFWYCNSSGSSPSEVVPNYPIFH